jgi:hypothetical protein
MKTANAAGLQSKLKVAPSASASLIKSDLASELKIKVSAASSSASTAREQLAQIASRRHATY